jgi:hypothetical protein
MGQLLRICKTLFKNSKTLFTERVFWWMMRRQLKNEKLKRYHLPFVKEALEENIHEESCQEDLDDEDPDETLVSILPLDEGEVLQPYLPPAHENEDMISFNDADDLVEDLYDVVDQHIDDFIHVGRCRWDVGYFIFNRDPIYDVEDDPQAKGVELSFSEDWSSCIYDLDIRQANDDMVTYLFHSFEDDLSQYTYDDYLPFLENCDEYSFGDSNLFYEDFQPTSCSDLDGH